MLKLAASHFSQTQLKPLSKPDFCKQYYDRRYGMFNIFHSAFGTFGDTRISGYGIDPEIDNISRTEIYLTY